MELSAICETLAEESLGEFLGAVQWELGELLGAVQGELGCVDRWLWSGHKCTMLEE